MSSCGKGQVCEVKAPPPGAGFCTQCGRKGKAVEAQTLEHLLVEPFGRQLNDAPYYFCATPDCNVVYFSPSSGTTFLKRDLRVRVGIKETDDPIPICYCFGHTRASAWQEIERTGSSTVVESIKREIQAGRCQCEIKNPSGKCCLGEVTRVIREGMRIRGQPGSLLPMSREAL